MAKFKVAVSFVDCNFEEIFEIEAKSLKSANEQCQKIKEDNAKNVKLLKSRNVYTNRIIKDCKIYKMDWRQDLLRCVGFLEKKDENIL